MSFFISIIAKLLVYHLEQIEISVNKSLSRVFFFHFYRKFSKTNIIFRIRSNGFELNELKLPGVKYVEEKILALNAVD